MAQPFFCHCSNVVPAAFRARAKPSGVQTGIMSSRPKLAARTSGPRQIRSGAQTGTMSRRPEPLVGQSTCWPNDGTNTDPVRLQILAGLNSRYLGRRPDCQKTSLGVPNLAQSRPAQKIGKPCWRPVSFTEPPGPGTWKTNVGAGVLRRATWSQKFVKPC